MHLELDLIDETESFPKETLELIERMLNHAAVSEGIEEGSELSVSFVSNSKIQEINREYRGKDTPTDVISFAMEEMGEGEMEIQGVEGPRLLGDIVISVDRAKEQASDYGHSYEREIGFLAIHGFLHLLGYDHMESGEEKTMNCKQEQILLSFGLSRESDEKQ
jgi:probable rRNA maturation factor